MSTQVALSRRSFIGATLAAGGSVLFYVGGNSPRAATSSTATLVGGWIRIAPDGAVSVFSRTTELGQGALTSLTLIVAEELELDVASVAVEMAPVTDDFVLKTKDGAAYYATWGSDSSRDMDQRMRKVAATARTLLLQAAAGAWGVPADECTIERGVVHHVSGRSSTYASLAHIAATLPIPRNVAPKARAEWRRLGKATPRVDIPPKIDGSAIYGVDVRRPGMLVATIAQCPMFGGTLASVDGSAVETMPGVKKVVALDDAVAVIADGYWPAKRALGHLRPVWRAGARTAADTAAHAVTLRTAVRSPDHLFVPEGANKADLLAAHAAGMAAGATHLEAYYEVPFLAHAPMEPMNATAHVRAGEAELWVPTQYQSMVREVVAEILGLAREKVTVHTTVVGGGFGRRTEIDYAAQAAKIARHVTQPVKLIWSREEDMSRGYFRPMAAIQVNAALDAQGQPTAFSFTAACPSILDYSIERRHGTPQAVIDDAGLANARDWPYAVPAQKISLASTDLGVPVTWMRSVGSAASVFALESFLDELATAARSDPIAYRRHLLRLRPRELAVVDKVASLARWDTPPERGRYRGFGLNAANGSVVAQIVEISVDAQRMVTLHRVHCVVDCGVAFNPDAVVAQMEGGIIFGLSGALFGEISLKDGAVLQKNFDHYPLLTLAQTPAIEVSILQSDAPVGGVGEEAVPPIAPALANALFAATGQRLRSLPLMRNGFTLGNTI